MIESDITFILFMIVVFLAWWLFFVAQQNYWLDYTRQRLFTIRDEFFDAALRKDISFQNPSYCTVRTTLNGMIQFTHEVNLMQIFVMIYAHKFIYKGRRSSDYQQNFMAAFNELSMDNKKLVLRTLKRAHHAMLRHIISTSPLLWCILKPLSIVFAIFHLTKRTQEKVLSRTFSMDLSKLKFWIRNSRKDKLRSLVWPVIDAEANYIGKEINMKGCPVG